MNRVVSKQKERDGRLAGLHLLSEMVHVAGGHFMQQRFASDFLPFLLSQLRDEREFFEKRLASRMRTNATPALKRDDLAILVTSVTATRTPRPGSRRHRPDLEASQALPDLGQPGEVFSSRHQLLVGMLGILGSVVTEPGVVDSPSQIRMLLGLAFQIAAFHQSERC